jgi:peptidoglycan/xylan/chitin deacetylase (PgdA/CDA1 family)
MIIKNFLFHRVSDDADRLWPPMSTSLFRSLIAYITRQYHVVNLEEYLLSNERIQTKKRLATILFDDGYKDNIEYALPILEEYKCPASFYVVSDCIDKNIPTWTYITDYLFQHTRAQALELDMEFVPATLRQTQFKSPDDRLNFGSRLKPWMKGLQNKARQQVLARLQSSFHDVQLPSTMMNWNDLRQMQQAGYTVGSHSVTHPLLATVEADDDLFFELKGSADRIQAELGKSPVTISYPIGSYDERVKAYSRQAGYQLGLAVDQRFYDSIADDLFAIPRVELYNEPMWKCRMRISGIYSWAKSRIQR